jgi:hypothetical protein
MQNKGCRPPDTSFLDIKGMPPNSMRRNTYLEAKLAFTLSVVHTDVPALMIGLCNTFATLVIVLFVAALKMGGATGRTGGAATGGGTRTMVMTTAAGALTGEGGTGLASGGPLENGM